MSEGIQFLIDLNSRTQGAALADTALARVEAASADANRQIDKLLHTIERVPKGFTSDAGWSKGVGHLQTMTKGAQLADREFAAVRNRTNEISSSLQEMGHEGHKSESLWREFVYGELAVKGLEKGLELAKEAATEFYHVIKETVAEVADERREKMAMTNLLGGKEEAEAALHYLDRFAELSEFGEKRTKAMGIELINAGYAGQKWRDAMAAIADVASMSPDKGAGAEGALSALERMQLSGRVDSRTLRGLRLNTKDVIKGLGDSLGMSPESVKKGLQDGSIPAVKAFDVILRELEKKTGRRLGEAGLEAGRGLDAKLTRASELPSKIMKALADSPEMDKIERTFDRVLESFDPEGPGGRGMIKGLQTIMGAVGDALDEVDWNLFGERVELAADAVTKLAKPLRQVVELMGDAVDIVVRAPQVVPDSLKFIFGAGNPLSALALARDIGQGYAGTLNAREKRHREDVEASNQFSPGELAAVQANHGGGAGVHMEGKAQVVVNVNQANASPQDIEHATRAGVETGMTTALEQSALQAGARAARKKR